MKIRRSPLLGALAFYPLVLLGVISLLPGEPFVASADAGELRRFWAQWGYFLLGAPVIAIMIFFSVHVFRRGAVIGWRRMLWLTGFWLVGPIVLPAYWWFDAHAT